MRATSQKAVNTTQELQGLPPLPAINVHFFAETNTGEALFQQAMADRHLRRVHAEIHAGGIPGAVNTYAQSPTPELLVVESSAQPNELFQQLAALAEVVVKGTQVVVVGHVNDLFLYRQLLEQGLADYLALPMPVEQLIVSLSRLFLSAPDAKVGRVVSFMGAKGGVGSSIIAHNISWLLAERHALNTVVADLDLAFGTAGIDFGVVTAQTIADALGNGERLDEAIIDKLLHKCSEHLMLLAAPCALDEVVPIQENVLNNMIDLLRQVLPLTVLDLPSDWDNWMRAAITQSEKLVITSTPELASMRNLKVLVDAIRQLRPNEEAPLLVLNQVGMGKRPEVPVQKFVETVGLHEYVTIPFDEEGFGKAALEGRMVLEVSKMQEVAQAFERIAAWIAGMPETTQQDIRPKKGLSGLLDPLKEKLLSGRKKAE